MTMTFEGAVKAAQESIKYQVDTGKATIAKAKAHHVGKLFSALQNAEPLCTMWIGTYACAIQVPVKSMKHMLEVIEAAEALLGFELDDSQDDASSGQRHFTSKAYDNSWFRISAQVTKDSSDATALCRRVQVGVKTVEVAEYKLECTDPV